MRTLSWNRGGCVVALALALLAAPLRAAIVDIDYAQVRGTPFGDAVLRELRLDGDGVARRVQRLRVMWQGAESPLVIGVRGVPAATWRCDAADPIDTAHGAATPLPRDPRYAVAEIAPDEVLIGTKAGLDQRDIPPWPAPANEALSCLAVPADMNLQEFADRVPGFDITLSKDHLLVARAHCRDRKAAHALMGYIGNSIPLLSVAAAVGVEKAQFPKRMIDAAVIERRGTEIAVTIDLAGDRKLREDADDFLLSTLRRVMKRAP